MSPCSNAFFQKDIPWATVPQDVNRWYLKTGFCVQIVWDLYGGNFFTVELFSGFRMLMSIVTIQRVT